MAIKSGYNGWDKFTRKRRGDRFYYLIKLGKILKPKHCELCGRTMKQNPLSYHAEDYGPTWEDYVAGVRTLCCFCHGMLHMRFRWPNRWQRYLYRIKTNYPRLIFYHMGQFFQQTKSFKDIETFIAPQEVNMFGDWRDSITTTAYKGDKKRALKWEDEMLVFDDFVYTPEQLKLLEEGEDLE